MSPAHLNCRFFDHFSKVWKDITVGQLTSVELWAGLIEMGDDSMQVFFGTNKLPPSPHEKAADSGKDDSSGQLYRIWDFYAHLQRYLGPDVGRHNDPIAPEFLHRAQRSGVCSWYSFKMVMFQVLGQKKYNLLNLDLETDFLLGRTQNLIDDGGLDGCRNSALGLQRKMCGQLQRLLTHGVESNLKKARAMWRAVMFWAGIGR